MDRETPLRPNAGAAVARLDPRNALDILDSRTARQSRAGAAELAARADAGPDVLHYLAAHGAPATRAATAGRRP